MFTNYVDNILPNIDHLPNPPLLTFVKEFFTEISVLKNHDLFEVASRNSQGGWNPFCVFRDRQRLLKIYQNIIVQHEKLKLPLLSEDDKTD